MFARNLTRVASRRLNGQGFNHLIQINRTLGTYFVESHEYVRVEGGVATVGITAHAAGALGDVVFVELPGFSL